MLCLASVAMATPQRFALPEFRTGYQLPQVLTTPANWAGWTYVDAGMLLAALAASAWWVFARRSRRGALVITIISLLYFGFFRHGCICPVGSIQNVAMAAGNNGYALPWTAAFLFLVPLLFTLFFGRIFCASVCPLGAIQDIVLFKPIQVPLWLEAGLGVLAYLYLGIGVLFAFLGSDFVICRYDPFVAMFRLSGSAPMLFLGACLLLSSMFIGRTYCRFLCPYSILLRLLAPFSRRRLTITPGQCVDCRLCEEACPFGAIRTPTVLSGMAPPGAGDRAASRRLALGMLLAGVAFTGLFAMLGRLSAPALIRMDFNANLAVRLAQEDQGSIPDPNNHSETADAFRKNEGRQEKNHAAVVAQLIGSIEELRHKYAIGGTLLGLWIGLVVSAKLLSASSRRPRTGYTADAAACVACARCYAACPVEQGNTTTVVPLTLRRPGPAA